MEPRRPSLAHYSRVRLPTLQSPVDGDDKGEDDDRDHDHGHIHGHVVFCTLYDVRSLHLYCMKYEVCWKDVW